MLNLTLENLDSVRIWVPADVESAAEALFSVVNSVIDARIGASHNIASRAPLVNDQGEVLATKVFGWPDSSDSWWRAPLYAFGSPLPTACRYESEPFWCNGEGVRAGRPNPFLAELDVSNFEQRALVHAAVVAPVHLPFGQIGAVSIVPNSPSHTDLSDLFAEHGAAFGLFARTFIAGYVAAMTEKQHLPREPQLRKREIECLQWVADGKSDDMIAELMSITVRTVRFHITNAMMKLNAANRSQATIKAGQLGYLKIR